MGAAGQNLYRCGGSVKFDRDNKISVLDHGHVFVVDRLGSDESIEEAARLSYKGQRPITETRNLLRYLMRHLHTSPFEQAVISVNMKMPIFVARQLVRHRTQALNEISARYTTLPTEFYIPEVEQVCHQSSSNKQGRSTPVPEDLAHNFREELWSSSQTAFELYEKMTFRGIARETARLSLPVNAYTEWQTTINAHNLMHMMLLRRSKHAQWETRQYAYALEQIFQDWLPVTYEAWMDYRVNSCAFSAAEMEIIRAALDQSKLTNAIEEANPERISARAQGTP
jgi:thymidylate synthase (FAD)